MAYTEPGLPVQLKVFHGWQHVIYLFDVGPTDTIVLKMKRGKVCQLAEIARQVTGEFELDHFEPQSLAPGIAFDYFNLVYACRRCNLVKQDQSIDDRDAAGRQAEEPQG